MTLQEKENQSSANQEKIFIERFDITKIKLPEIYFSITCSKGTFIRVIADDFGKKLHTGAILTELRRIGIGNFRVEDAITLETFSNNFQMNSILK
ncbi:MAG: hypothetical protein M5T52_15430 [Ignavibacteriaceae bacterium]|nr:hypothetical protein [Ignavibacteriaceae bacterium]